MIRVVAAQENNITVCVASSIDTDGFSAQISFSGVDKTLSEIYDGKEYGLTFSAEEVAQFVDTPTYGTIIVLDSDGNEYQKSLVKIEVVPEEEWFKAIDYSTIAITLAANWVGNVEEGGGGGDMSNYVTKSQLRESNADNKRYTDEKVGDVVVEALERQTVTVKDQDGHDVSMTVKDSVQNSVTIKGTVDNLVETSLKGKIKDEDDDGMPDDDTIYLYTGNDARRRKQ